MARPLLLVVRETPSLAESVQLLLETMGFRVVGVDRVSEAVGRLAEPGDEPIEAVVVACNQPRSATLALFPESFPASARNLPLLVVGDRARGSRHGWPANVRFVPLPFDARGFVEMLGAVTRHEGQLVAAGAAHT